MDPIAEQIIQEMALTLSGVSVVAGFQNTFSVTREDLDGISPVDGTLAIVPVEPEQDHKGEPCLLDEYEMKVGLIVYAIEPQASEKVISARLLSCCADIRKALGADVHRGGRAVNTTFEKDQIFAAAQPSSAMVIANVRFRTLYNNPYER